MNLEVVIFVIFCIVGIWILLNGADLSIVASILQAAGR